MKKCVLGLLRAWLGSELSHTHIRYIWSLIERDWAGVIDSILSKGGKNLQKNWIMLRWILYTIHMIKFTNLIWFFLSERVFFSFHHSIYRDQNCQVLVQTDKQKALKITRKASKVAHFASMVSQLTKKQPLIIITLTFSRDFSLVKFREAETYKSGCVLLWFVSNLSQFPFLPILLSQFPFPVWQNLSYFRWQPEYLEIHRKLPSCKYRKWSSRRKVNLCQFPFPV